MPKYSLVEVTITPLNTNTPIKLGNIINPLVISENVQTKDIFVNADKLRLRELCNNLITNAVKYTPEEGGKIEIDGVLKMILLKYPLGIQELG